jgi:hypothetical protein
MAAKNQAAKAKATTPKVKTTDEAAAPEINYPAEFIATLTGAGVPKPIADKLLKEYTDLCIEIPKMVHKTGVYMQRKGMARILFHFGLDETFFKGLNRAITPIQPRAKKAAAVENVEPEETEKK